MSKTKIVGISVLTVFLFSLCTPRTTQAVPTPDEILNKLQTRLDTIISSKATQKRDKLLGGVTKLVDRFKANKVSLTKFLSRLDGLQKKADKAQERFEKKIARLTQKAIKKLQKTGADQSFIDTAQDKEGKARNDRDVLYDDLDEAIDDARDLASPSA